MRYHFDTSHALQTLVNKRFKANIIPHLSLEVVRLYSLQSTKNGQHSQTAATHPRRWRYSTTVCWIICVFLSMNTSNVVSSGLVGISTFVTTSPFEYRTYGFVLFVTHVWHLSWLQLKQLAGSRRWHVRHAGSCWHRSHKFDVEDTPQLLQRGAWQ